MKMSADTGKAISLILIYTGLLFFLIGMAARWKSDFHSRADISTAALSTAAVLAGLALILFLVSWKRKPSKPNSGT
jgi:multisubunit Na+/H+ antiporter MnhG subunit